jgi:hypothetical protein
MPWFRLETEIIRHPKVQEIPAGERPGALALFVAALAYCSEMLTNGHIPRSVLAGLAHEIGLKRPRKVTEKLLVVGLFEQSNGDFFVHDYLDFQPSRADVQARRKADAQRQRKHRKQQTFALDNSVSHVDSHAVTQPVTRARMRAGADAHTPLSTSRAVDESRGEGNGPGFDIPRDLLKEMP